MDQLHLCTCRLTITKTIWDHPWRNLAVQVAEMLGLCCRIAQKDLAVREEIWQTPVLSLYEQMACLQFLTHFSPREEGFCEALNFPLFEITVLGMKHHPVSAFGPTVFILWQGSCMPPSCPHHVSKRNCRGCNHNLPLAIFFCAEPQVNILMDAFAKWLVVISHFILNLLFLRFLTLQQSHQQK